MHLLQDTSQPQHVRNENHLDYWPYISKYVSVSTPLHSHIEDYGSANWQNFNYANSMLDWQGLGFTKLEDFWDRHLYNGDPQALDSDANGGTQLGLAEFCNGNFLGERHSYGDYFRGSDIHYYSYPRRDTSTDYYLKKSYLSSGIGNYLLHNGYQGKGIYLRKTGDGITFAHHSRFTYEGVKRPTKSFPKATTIDDDNVLSDYHNLLIPKAVEYSAGILDYFFRGTFTVTLSWSTNLQIYTNTVLNISRQDFSGGAFFLFQDDTNGIRTFVLQTNLSDPLPNYGTMDIISPGPVPQGTKFTIVYQGTIGINGDKTALDPVDKDIAIAVGVSSNTVWYSSFEGGVNSEPTDGDYFAEGWHVDSGSVDLAANGIWEQQAYEGNFLLDLDGINPGTISTNITTVSNQIYRLSFVYSRNPDGIWGRYGSPPNTPSAEVLIDGDSLGTLDGDIDNSWTDLQWQPVSYTFTATSSSTTLTFHSLDDDSPFGILLDAISLAVLSGTNGGMSQ